MGGRRLVRVGALAVALALAGAVPSLPASAEPNTNVRVTVMYGSYAIEKASVSVQPVAGGEAVTTCTGADGVAMREVDAGSYVLRINGALYLNPTTADGSWPVRSGETIELVIPALNGSAADCGATPPGSRPAAPTV